MKISMILFLLAIILSWVSAQTSHPRPINQPAKNQSFFSEATVQSAQGNEEEDEEEAYNARVSRVGSRPPSCQHKCQGCNPCHPVQIPTTSATLSLHYANYEPEGWKCTCGSSFFNP